MVEIDKEWSKQMSEMFENDEVSKYLKKYQINNGEIGNSLCFKTFVVLIFSLKNDMKIENLKIKFSVIKKVSFGRDYLRYSINLKGNFISEELFIQVPYKIWSYKDGSLFTLFNIYEEINGLDYELSNQKNELIKQSYSDFVTNYKH